MNDDWSKRLREIGASTMPGHSALPEQTSPATLVRGQFGRVPPAATANPFEGLPPNGNAAPVLSPAVTPGGNPVTVRVACLALWLAALAAVVSAGMGVFWLVELRDDVDRALHLDPSGTATAFVGGYADDVQFWVISAAVGVGLICAIAYALIGWAVRAGRSWPRWVSTVLAVLSLPLLFLGPMVAMVLFGVVAVIAMWTPTARQFARATAEDRRAVRA